MEGQFLSLACILWSVHEINAYPISLNVNGMEKSIQFHPDFQPIKFVRWDKFGDKFTDKKGKYYDFFSAL